MVYHLSTDHKPDKGAYTVYDMWKTWPLLTLNKSYDILYPLLINLVRMKYILAITALIYAKKDISTKEAAQGTTTRIPITHENR